MQPEQALRRYLPMTETMAYILLSLTEERHGYGIMQHVQHITEGRLTLGAGTIYQSLAKLSSDGLIAPTETTERQKKYRMTEMGRAVLAAEARRVEALYRNLEGYR